MFYKEMFILIWLHSGTKFTWGKGKNMLMFFFIYSFQGNESFFCKHQRLSIKILIAL